MEYQLPPPPAAPGVGAHQVPVGVMQGTLTHVQAQDDRWTQYQQLWRQHVYMNGTTLDEFLFCQKDYCLLRDYLIGSFSLFLALFRLPCKDQRGFLGCDNGDQRRLLIGGALLIFILEVFKQSANGCGFFLMVPVESVWVFFIILLSCLMRRCDFLI